MKLLELKQRESPPKRLRLSKPELRQRKKQLALLRWRPKLNVYAKKQKTWLRNSPLKMLRQRRLQPLRLKQKGSDRKKKIKSASSKKHDWRPRD